jgi:hypothetical protein
MSMRRGLNINRFGKLYLIDMTSNLLLLLINEILIIKMIGKFACFNEELTGLSFLPN